MISMNHSLSGYWRQPVMRICWKFERRWRIGLLSVDNAWNGDFTAKDEKRDKGSAFKSYQ